MKFFTRVVFLLLVWAIFPVVSAFAGSTNVLVQENGIFENAQVALLFLAGVVFMVRSFTEGRKVRHIFWMGTWFCLSCILRELDVEDLTVPQWVSLLGSGMGRNLLMGFGWIVLSAFFIKLYPELKGSFRKFYQSRTAIFLLSSGSILFLGSVFDHRSVSSDQSKFWEELFETIGYFLLLLASFSSKSIFSVQPEDLAALSPESEDA